MSRGLDVPDADEVIANAASDEVTVEQVVDQLARNFEASVRSAMAARATSGRCVVPIIARAETVNSAYSRFRQKALLKGYTLNSMQKWTRNQRQCYLTLEWTVRP